MHMTESNIQADLYNQFKDDFVCFLLSQDGVSSLSSIITFLFLISFPYTISYYCYLQ